MATASLDTKVVEVEKVIKTQEEKCVGITLNLSINEAFTLFHEIGMSDGNMTWDVFKKLQEILNNPISLSHIDGMAEVEKSEEFNNNLKKLKEQLHAI